MDRQPRNGRRPEITLGPTRIRGANSKAKCMAKRLASTSQPQHSCWQQNGLIVQSAHQAGDQCGHVRCALRVQPGSRREPCFGRRVLVRLSRRFDRLHVQQERQDHPHHPVHHARTHPGGFPRGLGPKCVFEPRRYRVEMRQQRLGWLGVQMAAQMDGDLVPGRHLIGQAVPVGRDMGVAPRDDQHRRRG